jgi:hypothetical protein
VDPSHFSSEPKYIPVCWKLQSKRVLSMVASIDCSRLKTVSAGFLKGTAEGNKKVTRIRADAVWWFVPSTEG